MSVARSHSIRSTDDRPDIKAKRSIKSPFSAIFGGRTSQISHFSIDLEDEDDFTHGLKKYGPGETVKGTVNLHVARPLGVTHVVLRLSGFVDVFKNHKQRSSRSDEHGRIPKKRGRRWTSEYYGDGFASLFEDEIVLCGQGTLDPGRSPYGFKFEVEFPSHLALPSSISFERGQITYNVSATVTRPHAVRPTITKTRPIKYQEDIDLAQLQLPVPREATLRPIVPNTSSKASIRRLTASDRQSTRTSTTTTIRSNDAERNSIISNDAQSSTATDSRRASRSPNADSGTSLPGPGSTNPAANWGSPNPINGPHVSIELTRSGCLPGQLVHVWVKIDNHSKPIRSTQGIIVTLFREGRTDFQPNLPLSSDADGQGKYEDLYPRSKSGIGGMSMDNAGSDKKFQQDLSQTVAPLIINPLTRSAAMKIAVRVPDDAFPTIRGVPGNMISFRYYVQVIIDIQGKLSTNDRAFANTTAKSPRSPFTDAAMLPDPASEAHMTLWAPNCIDTSSLAQNKHAVRLKSELVVGTRDTARLPAAQTRAVSESPAMSGAQDSTMSRSGYAPSPTAAPYEAENGYHHPRCHHEATPRDEWDPYDHSNDQWGYDGYDYDQWYGYDHHSSYGYGYQGAAAAQHGHAPFGARPPHFDQPFDPSMYPQSASPIAPPEEERGLSEKERMRRHEAALQPSQPDGPSRAEQVPTAPSLLEDNEQLPLGPTSSAQSRHHAGVFTAPAPAYHESYDLSQSSVLATPVSTSAQDKQEMERLRHATLASFPSYGGISTADDQATASAPHENELDGDSEQRVLSENERATTDERAGASESTEPHEPVEQAAEEGPEALPRYER